MSETTENTPTRIGRTPEEIRAKLFEDLASIEAYAEATDKSPRTVQRMIAMGLPIVKVGNTPYIVLSKAPAFIMAKQREHNQPRCGQPRAKRAA